MRDNQAMQRRLDCFIKNIFHISDQKYQQSVWVHAEGKQCEEIDDAVCDFFDEGDSIIDNYQDFGITETQHQYLLALREKLDFFMDEHEIFSQQIPVSQLINLPEWHEVMKSAKDVLRVFHYKKKLTSYYLSM